MRMRWLAVLAVSAVAAVAVRACRHTSVDRAPAPPPVACPRPGPLAAEIAALRDRDGHAATLQRLHARVRPRRVAVVLGEALACADLPLRYGILGAIEREGSELDGAMPAVARLLDDLDPTT